MELVPVIVVLAIKTPLVMVLVLVPLEGSLAAIVYCVLPIVTLATPLGSVFHVPMDIILM